MAAELVTVDEAGRVLGVSRATVWRLIQRGELPSIRRSGRRLVPSTALRAGRRRRQAASVAPLALDHPIFRLVGAGRSGGRLPGARDKHGILDR